MVILLSFFQITCGKPYTTASPAPWRVDPITTSSQPTTNRHCCGIDEAALLDRRRQHVSMDGCYGWAHELKDLNTWVHITPHFPNQELVITLFMVCGMNLLNHSKTSMVETLMFWNGYISSSTLYRACDYLSMLGINFAHVSKRG